MGFCCEPPVLMGETRKLNSLGSILLRCSWVRIMKVKRSLSFSNKPLQTLLKIAVVKRS